MARQRRGEPGSEQATQKWRQTMLNRFGSMEALHEHMQSMGSEGGKRGTNGGFASNKVGADGLTGIQRARICGSKGGKISRRGPAKEKKNGGD